MRVRLQTLWDEAALAFVRAELLAATELYGRIGSMRDEAVARLQPGGNRSARGSAKLARSRVKRSRLAFGWRAGADAHIAEALAPLAVGR